MMVSEAQAEAKKENGYQHHLSGNGCMGAIMHLFHFNQALLTRKLLLSHHKHGSSNSENERGSAGGSCPEASKVGGNERSGAKDRPKRAVPMKALIARELSRPPEATDRGPNVVARLMGLDRMPGIERDDGGDGESDMPVYHCQKPDINSRDCQVPHNASVLRATKREPPLENAEIKDWEDSNGRHKNPEARKAKYQISGKTDMPRNQRHLKPNMHCENYQLYRNASLSERDPPLENTEISGFEGINSHNKNPEARQAKSLISDKTDTPTFHHHPKPNTHYENYQLSRNASLSKREPPSENAEINDFEGINGCRRNPEARKAKSLISDKTDMLTNHRHPKPNVHCENYRLSRNASLPEREQLLENTEISSFEGINGRHKSPEARKVKSPISDKTDMLRNQDYPKPNKSCEDCRLSQFRTDIARNHNASYEDHRLSHSASVLRTTNLSESLEESQELRNKAKMGNDGELKDAVEFLQSNKELFLKLVCSPDSSSYSVGESRRDISNQSFMTMPTNPDGHIRRTACYDHPIPTRIVVLKPNRGKATDRTAISARPIQGMPTNGSNPSYPLNLRSTSGAMKEDVKNISGKDRQEIRRGGGNRNFAKRKGDGMENSAEIARQVRERVARDLGLDSGRVIGRPSPLLSRLGGSDSIIDSDGELSASSRNLFCNYEDNLPSLPILHQTRKSLNKERVREDRNRKDTYSSRKNMNKEGMLDDGNEENKYPLRRKNNDINGMEKMSHDGKQEDNKYSNGVTETSNAAECFDEVDVSTTASDSLKSVANLLLHNSELKDSEKDTDNICGGLDNSSDHCLKGPPETDERLSSSVHLIGEKLEQPSPVSVLDCPFSEDATSPANFKQIRSDLQELRFRLQLLKSDYSEAPWQGTKISPEDCSPCIEDDRAFKEVKMEEEETAYMHYARRVLRFAGFTTSSHIPSPLLDPNLFARIEECYNRKKASPVVEGSKHRKEMGMEDPKFLDTASKHLIFDCVNEVLLDILGPSSNPKLLVKSLTMKSVGSVEELVKRVLTEIRRRLYTPLECRETLESLVVEDLAKEGSAWLSFPNEAESISFELEKALLEEEVDAILSTLCKQCLSY